MSQDFLSIPEELIKAVYWGISDRQKAMVKAQAELEKEFGRFLLSLAQTICEALPVKAPQYVEGGPPWFPLLETDLGYSGDEIFVGWYFDERGWQPDFWWSHKGRPYRVSRPWSSVGDEGLSYLVVTLPQRLERLQLKVEVPDGEQLVQEALLRFKENLASIESAMERS